MSEIELFAWIGADEESESGIIGLKQGMTPCGLIPLVATTQGKMDQTYIVKQIQTQATRYARTIRLARFVLVEDVITIEP